MIESPKGWADTTLGSVIQLNYGKSLPKSDRKPGPFKVFGSNGVVGTSTESITKSPTIIV
jgi:type I restriction enzyme S subunit